jgi:hypothetical protein
VEGKITEKWSFHIVLALFSSEIIRASIFAWIIVATTLLRNYIVLNKAKGSAYEHFPNINCICIWYNRFSLIGLWIGIFIWLSTFTVATFRSSWFVRPLTSCRHRGRFAFISFRKLIRICLNFFRVFVQFGAYLRQQIFNASFPLSIPSFSIRLWLLLLLLLSVFSRCFLFFCTLLNHVILLDLLIIFNNGRIILFSIVVAQHVWSIHFVQ